MKFKSCPLTFCTVHPCRDPTPNPGVKAPFNDTLTKWERFGMDDNLKVFYLDAEISTKEIYHQHRYAFFREYLPYLIDRPLVKRNKGHGIVGADNLFIHIYLDLYFFIQSFIRSLVCPSVCLSVRTSVCACVRASVRPPIRPSVRPSV